MRGARAIQPRTARAIAYPHLAAGGYLSEMKVVIGAICAVVAAILVASAGREAWIRHRVEQELPPRGRMVDVGGHRLQIDCQGTGTPVVVFESGLDANGSLSWYKVQGEVASFTRACAYSRAGILWSEAAAGPRDGTAVATDLHRLLERAGERPPYVLVRHSVGW